MLIEIIFGGASNIGKNAVDYMYRAYSKRGELIDTGSDSVFVNAPRQMFDIEKKRSALKSLAILLPQSKRAKIEFMGY